MLVMVLILVVIVCLIVACVAFSIATRDCKNFNLVCNIIVAIIAAGLIWWAIYVYIFAPNIIYTITFKFV